MPKYRVELTRNDSFYMIVDAEDEEAALQEASDVAPGLCASDSGWGQNWSVDAGEWDEESITELDDECKPIE